MCVLYRDQRTRQARELGQALSNAGIWTKTINTDLTEVSSAEQLSPGMVQVLYTEQGAAKLDSVMGIVRSLVPEAQIAVEAQARPKLGRGDEIQIRLF